MFATGLQIFCNESPRDIAQSLQSICKIFAELDGFANMMQQLCKTIAAVLQGILQNVCNRFAKSLQNSCIHIKTHQTCFCMILQTIRNAAWGTASNSLQKICKESDGEFSSKILAIS